MLAQSNKRTNNELLVSWQFILLITKTHIKSIETGHLTSCANGQLLRDMLASTLRRKKQRERVEQEEAKGGTFSTTNTCIYNACGQLFHC